MPPGRPGGVVEAAGFEPASASAPSVRFYERSSRFSFTSRDGPGHRRGASPLGVPPEHRARTRRVSPLNDTGTPGRGLPGPMSYSLVKQLEPFHRWRVSFVAGVLRVSSKLGSSHRTLTTPVEAYAPPFTAYILPFWRDPSIWCERPRRTLSGGGVPSWRVRSRGWRSSWRSRAACRTGACGWRRRARA